MREVIPRSGACGETSAKILLVDDEVRILEVFSDMLLELGHSVVTSADPAGALQLIGDDKFDIVFLDQFLGRTRGTDLMQQMAARDPDLSFVIVTANGSPDLAVDSLQLGASDFITKPFFEEDLVRSIASVQKKRAENRRQKSRMTEMERRIREQSEELIHVHFSVLAALARAVEKKDLGTYGHSMRVSTCAEGIAECMGLSPGQRHDLRTAALLHDIGKIGISDTILGKAGPLTPAERAIVRRHPENGVEILKPLKHYHRILPPILHHHEHYDGSGYPSGSRAEEIPLNARIIAVADTYDAIISDRPYRHAADQARAFAVLRSKSGTQFDPAVVRAFLSIVAECKSDPGLLEGLDP